MIIITTLELSTVPVKEFYGQVRQKMPQLVAEGRTPASVAYIGDQRMNADEPFKSAFRGNYFFTGDGAFKREDGQEFKLQLNAPVLLGLKKDSKLSSGAMVIDNDSYEAVCGNRVLVLSADKAALVHQAGYVRDGDSDIFVPENDEVEEVLQFLFRERIDLADYAGGVAEDTGKRSKSRVDKVLPVYLDKVDHASATGRSVVVGLTGSYSYVSGINYLDHYDGRLAGVAPEAHDAFEHPDLAVPTRRQVAQVVFEHLGSVNLRDAITQKGLEDALRGTVR